MQLDRFYVSEWGRTGGGSPPKWISFYNDTITDGIKFKVNPTDDDADQEFEVFYTL